MMAVETAGDRSTCDDERARQQKQFPFAELVEGVTRIIDNLVAKSAVCTYVSVVAGIMAHRLGGKRQIVLKVSTQHVGTCIKLKFSGRINVYSSGSVIRPFGPL